MRYKNCDSCHPTILDKLSEFAAQMAVGNKDLFSEEHTKASSLVNATDGRLPSRITSSSLICQKRRNSFDRNCLTCTIIVYIPAKQRDDNFCGRAALRTSVVIELRNYEQVFPGNRPFLPHGMT